MKTDEIALFNKLRVTGLDFEQPGNLIFSAGEELNMTEKRFYKILEQWEDKGWWDYGINIHSGWFTDIAPKCLEKKNKK